MEKELVKFNENITFIDGMKDICEYNDENGNKFMLSVMQLLCNCEYTELEEPRLKMARFNNDIPNDMVLNKIKKTIKKDKFEVTKNQKDQGTIIDVDTEVSQVWFVRNTLKLSSAFNSKEEAIKYADEWNKNIISRLNTK